MTTKPVFILGDVHGKYKDHRWKKIFNYIQDSLIVCVGDFGVGFAETLEEEMELLDSINRELVVSGNELLVARGNHENPKFFDGTIQCDFSCLKFIPDYEQTTLLGYRTLFVGGGISIDRKWRTEGLDYWKDEGVKPIPEHIRNEKFDLIVSHNCPNFVNHSSQNLYDEPGNPVKTDAYNERLILDDLYNITKPKKWFYGHYHNSEYAKIGNTHFRCLDELEIIELT